MADEVENVPVEDVPHVEEAPAEDVPQDEPQANVDPNDPVAPSPTPSGEVMMTRAEFDALSSDEVEVANGVLILTKTNQSIKLI
jgi:hypothetical protein